MSGGADPAGHPRFLTLTKPENLRYSTACQPATQPIPMHRLRWCGMRNAREVAAAIQWAEKPAV